MKRYLFLTFSILLIACDVQAGRLSVTLLSSKDPVEIAVKEVEQGVQAIIDYRGKKGDEAGNVELYLDDVYFEGVPFKKTPVHETRILPMEFLGTGDHILRCELQSSSGESYQAMVKFSYNSAPKIVLDVPEVDEKGMLNAKVELNIPGQADDLSGRLEIYIDEQFISAVKLLPDGPTTLAGLLPKPIFVTTLPQGIHLLTVQATAVSGMSSVASQPFSVNQVPQLKVIIDKQGQFQEAQAILPEQADGYSGIVEVFCKHNILATKREKDTVITFNRSEILEGLKKTILQLNEPLTLIFCVRGSNGAEYWQAVPFLP